eukprot:2258026-Rhodomonas_salina.1
MEESAQPVQRVGREQSKGFDMGARGICGARAALRASATFRAPVRRRKKTRKQEKGARVSYTRNGSSCASSQPRGTSERSWGREGGRTRILSLLNTRCSTMSNAPSW